MKLIEEAGWRWRNAGDGDGFVAYPPNGSAAVSFNPGNGNGDWRHLENNKARLRRAGLFDHVDAKRAAAREQAAGKLQQDRAQAQELIDRSDARTTTPADDTDAPTVVTNNDHAGDDMARRDKALFDLVARCEAVGWRTRSVGSDRSHVVVTPPDGKRPITIACGSGVVDYLTKVEAKLKRAGLAEAEAAKAAQDQKNRLQRIADDRARNRYTDTDTAPTTQTTDNGQSPALAPPPAAAGDCPGGYLTVDNIEVAEWAYVKTPVGAIDRKAVELLLEDSSVRYGCILGDFIGTSWQAVSRHRGAAHPELKPPRKSPKPRTGQPDLDPAPATRPAEDQVLHLFTLPPAAPAAAPVPVGSDYGARLAALLGPRRLSASDHAIITAGATFAEAADDDLTAVYDLTAVDDDDLRVDDDLTADGVLDDHGPADRITADDDDTPQPATPTTATSGGPATSSSGTSSTGTSSRPTPPPPDTDTPEPLVARIVTPAPPITRAALSTIAATAPATPVPAALNGHNNLAGIVANLQRYATLNAENEQLRAELNTIREQLADTQQQMQALRKELDTANAQGATLAEQCINKDSTVRRLRAELTAMAGDIEAARQLQALVFNLMNGGAQPG